jgi:hypothetical protein
VPFGGGDGGNCANLVGVLFGAVDLRRKPNIPHNLCFVGSGRPNVTIQDRKQNKQQQTKKKKDTEKEREIVEGIGEDTKC